MASAGMDGAVGAESATEGMGPTSPRTEETALPSQESFGPAGGGWG